MLCQTLVRFHDYILYYRSRYSAFSFILFLLLRHSMRKFLYSCRLPGTVSQAITGMNFMPSAVWINARGTARIPNGWGGIWAGYRLLLP